MLRRACAFFSIPIGLFVLSPACTSPTETVGGQPDASAPDATSGDVQVVEASSDASLDDPCSLPGTLQFTANGEVMVGGATPGHDLSFLTLPAGFCAHYYGNVGNVRQIRFAPGGELFAASPTAGTTGGGPNGMSAIVVLPDDDHDGTADTTITFLPNLQSTQGMLFANAQFYYQDGTAIMALPYATGQRAPMGTATQIANITIYSSGLHWPKPMDISDTGTIFVGNGGDQGESCDPSRPVHGGIMKLDGSAGGTPVAKGLRNAIAVRCAHGHNQCFAIELGKDYSNTDGGHEKLVPIHDVPAGGGPIDDWGFPCCATENVPFSGITPVPDCSQISPDINSFFIGDTPFGVDFESGTWPAPFTGDAFVVTHGVCCGSWQGARLVAIAMDPMTGLPLQSSDVAASGGGYGPNQGAMVNFATGWDDGSHAHGRPGAIAFSNDGRLFIGNDQNGDIFWIAPIQGGAAVAPSDASLSSP